MVDAHQLAEWVAETDRLLEARLDKLSEELDSNPVPTTIYHYTDHSGLKGILESGKLWFTDIFNLNDPSELRHGIARAAALLDKQVQDLPAYMRLFATNFSTFAASSGPREIAHFFTCSLSKDGDDLGQWRSYADNGRGFAIGFDGKRLEAAIRSVSGVASSTFHVSYDETALGALQQEFVGIVVEVLHRPTPGLTKEMLMPFLRDLSVVFSTAIIRSALLFKHPGYRNEREFRLMQLFDEKGPPNIRYRSRPRSLVRYLELDWATPAPEAIVSIIIGPAAARADAEQFIRDCQRAFRPSLQVTVSQSEIPYRVSY